MSKLFSSLSRLCVIAASVACLGGAGAPSCRGGLQSYFQELFLTSPDYVRTALFVDLSVTTWTGGVIDPDIGVSPTLTYRAIDGSLSLQIPAYCVCREVAWPPPWSYELKDVVPIAWYEATTINLTLPGVDVAARASDALSTEFWHYTGVGGQFTESRELPLREDGLAFPSVNQLAWQLTSRDAQSRFVTPGLLGGRMMLRGIFPSGLNRDETADRLGVNKPNFLAAVAYRSPLPNTPLVVQPLAFTWTVPEAHTEALSCLGFLMLTLCTRSRWQSFSPGWPWQTGDFR
jgi:hypothetical protein